MEEFPQFSVVRSLLIETKQSIGFSHCVGNKVSKMMHVTHWFCLTANAHERCMKEKQNGMEAHQMPENSKDMKHGIVHLVKQQVIWVGNK